MNTYYAPGTVLVTEDTEGKGIDVSQALTVNNVAVNMAPILIILGPEVLLLDHMVIQFLIF